MSSIKYMLHYDTNNLKIIGSGASAKKIYQIDDEKLLVDFSLCNQMKYEIFTINHIPNDTELKRFTFIYHFLSNINHCSLPQIFYFNDTQIILQNLGENTLLNLGLNNLKYGIFQKALFQSIDWLIHLSSISHQPNYYIAQRIYNSTDMKLEMDKFISLILPENTTDDKSRLAILIDDMVKDIFANSNECIIHRDFQSSNIIYHNNTIYAIDFQDCCLGIDLYDLVSLLYDLKILLSNSERENLLQYYLQKSHLEYDTTNFHRRIHLLATIRLCKSLTFRIKSSSSPQEIKRGYFLLQQLKDKLPEYSDFFNIIFQYLPRFETNLISIVLAGGKGTRMLSTQPKILHQLFHNHLVEYPLRLSKLIGSDKIYTVVGYQSDDVIQSIADPTIQYVKQEPQLGTGHAVMQVVPYLEKIDTSEKTDVLVLMGDCVALSFKIIRDFIFEFRNGGFSAGLLTSNVAETAKTSRIIRDEHGTYLGSVEFKDMEEKHRHIRETGCGIMIFKLDKLLTTIPKINNNNKQGEYYLPDVINILVKNGERVLAYKSEEIPETHGANTKDELAELERLLS